MGDNNNTQRINILQAFRQAPVLDFVLPGFLHQTTGVIIAPGATGKSILSIELAFSIALGRDVFRIFDDADIRPGKVIILNAEDPREIIETRVHGFADNFTQAEKQTISDNLDIIPCVASGLSVMMKVKDHVMETPGFKELTARIAEQKPRLVIFDTLNRISGGLDENDNAQMGQLMNTIERFNKAVGCASLIVHHANKGAVMSGNGDMQQAGRGASVVTDNGRWQVNLAGMTKDEAKKISMDDTIRRNWVKLDFSKINYGPQQGQKWLLRTSNGALRGDFGEPDMDSDRTSGKAM